MTIRRWAVVLAGVLLATSPVHAWRKKKGKAHPVAAFEQTMEAEKLAVVHANAELVDGDKKRKGKVIRVVTKSGESWSELSLSQVPADIRPMRTLRFWLKGDNDPDHELTVRIYDQQKEWMDYRIDTPPAKWVQHEIRLGNLRASREFDPTKIKEINFIWFRPKKAHTIFVDDVEFVEGKDGWRLSEKEQAAHIFGEKRIKKVLVRKTKHFIVWMDTKSAAKKFPQALEETYEDIRAMLALDNMKEPLPVYMFQNPNGYWDFCVRHLGWSRESAEDSAGHGSGRYFATYFQGNRTPTVTHELTHSMVHRVLGWGGGSWFQEGSAVYCEELDAGRSAARLFSPNVRGKRFVPLRRFIAMPRLIESKDVRGGAETSGSLYAQAGAVFEFLLRSAKARTPDENETIRDGEPFVGERIKKLARISARGDRRLETVEQIYGMSIEELEAAWCAWGGKPPKPWKKKRR